MSVTVAGMLLAVPRVASSDENDNKDKDKNKLQAVPFTFVGTAPGCAPFPPGSNIVTSAWLRGMGLPDNGGTNTQTVPPGTVNANSPVESNPPNPNRGDPHTGLLLNKNGPTSDCSSSGAVITGVKGTKLSATFKLDFDYRNGGHCGAGAPRFNLTTSDNRTFFFGCASGAQSAAPQDPFQWTHVDFTCAQAAPADPTKPPLACGPSGDQIKSLAIVFDEGTDSTSPQDPQGVGLAVLDNISINTAVIRTGKGVCPDGGDSCKGKSRDNDNDNNNND